MYGQQNSSSSEPTLPQRKRTPSFSSSLLDAIYRSIDESHPVCQDEERSTIKKQSTYNTRFVSSNRRDSFLEEEAGLTALRRGILIESWIEKQSCTSSLHSNSASTSSESSYGGGVGNNGIFSSSSETESSVKEGSRKTSGLPQLRSKQVSEKQRSPKREGGFSTTKLKAMKLYGELKKVKQPISPGGRIANFLNSIFSSGNAKKVKICSTGAANDAGTAASERKSKSACSSVTSFSRSCLSKTPPSRGKSSINGNKSKRSVRFYPVTVIVDEDSRPCGHKSIYEDDPGLMPIPVVQKTAKRSSFKENAVEGAQYIRNYQKKNISELDFRGFHSYIPDSEEENDDDDQSCSSSDLFELDHLMGIGRYGEELPVYETTNLRKNKAIANGLIL